MSKDIVGTASFLVDLSDFSAFDFGPVHGAPVKGLADLDLYLEDKALYSLIKVNDVELFFSEDQQQIKFNIDKKKYDKLIQFYIFDTKDESLFRKISILNYQSKTFYVGSFIVNEISKTIYQTDNVKPNDEYQNLYNHFLELINVSLDQM